MVPSHSREDSATALLRLKTQEQTQGLLVNRAIAYFKEKKHLMTLFSSLMENWLGVGDNSQVRAGWAGAGLR